MPKPPANPSPWLTTAVRQLRDAKGWTNEDLSRHSGVSGCAVRAMMADKSGISVYTLEKLAAAFRLKPSRLLAKAEKLSIQ